MSKKETNNLNITINNQEEENEVIISFSTLFKKLKKYFLIWLVAVVVFIGIAFGYSGISTQVSKPRLTALISFSFDGVEKGLDPNGREFDVYSVKNPAVIERALTELGINMDQLEPIREGITIDGRIPDDALRRLNVYYDVLNNTTNGSISAAEKILETTYFATQYEVYFDYTGTSLTDEEAVSVLNTILNTYTDYFYELYGYNEAVGNALAAVDYTLYDYNEAIDVFSNSLSSLQTYVKQLADEDDTRFRSSVTGYTFSDLYQSIKTVEEIELDKISSFITVNNITKDKDQALAYYEYRIKALGRDKAQYEETLKALEASIEAYQKDQIIVFGSTEDTNTQSTLTSQQYDDMFAQKNRISTQLAQTKQQINFYKDRQESLSDGKMTATQDQINRLEEDLAALNERVGTLVELVCDTSEDYYKNVTFSNAYNVLVPASNTTSNKISRIIDNAKMPLVLLELLGIVAYFGVAFVTAIVSDSRKNKQEIEKKKRKADEDDDAENSEESETETDKKKKNN